MGTATCPGPQSFKSSRGKDIKWAGQLCSLLIWADAREMLCDLGPNGMVFSGQGALKEPKSQHTANLHMRYARLCMHLQHRGCWMRMSRSGMMCGFRAVAPTWEVSQDFSSVCSNSKGRGRMNTREAVQLGHFRIRGICPVLIIFLFVASHRQQRHKGLCSSKPP